ncbi:MAG TPA: hypothetical protein VG964_02600 [Candidatus Saccharimonadales bacterium]|nr:hypothetical protein [Candidatus Saccharimonadales bacterium]
MKIKSFASSGFGRAILALTVAAYLLMPSFVAAITTISQGYTTSDQVSVGSIVSLKNNSSDEVLATSSNNVGAILGVVIDNGNSLLSLSNEKASQVQVATSGVVQVLVSNINGSISQGDEITASPISGVGMKATDNTKVVGIAQASLNNNNSSNETYTDKSGAKHPVVIGEIPVLINVSYYYKQPDKTIIPSAIQNVANAFAGKTVSTLPILISMGIFIATLIIVASIVYSMIRSSIISVGRNPMSQSAVYRDLTQMSALVIGILAVSVVSIYMVLAKL